jgi:hypothetical protein
MAPSEYKKLIERVEKLLRLAAPSSNTTEPERISAALEAAKVFSENDLVVRVRSKERRREPEWKREQPITWGAAWKQARNTSPQFDWVQGIARHDVTCADPTCGGLIERGEPVWMKATAVGFKYLHCDGPCEW